MNDFQNHSSDAEELGRRVLRELVMENTGPVRRRQWWIASSAALEFPEATPDPHRPRPLPSAATRLTPTAA